MSRTRENKSDLVMLFEIRNLIEKSSAKFGFDKGELTISRIHNQLNDLNSKFDELRDIVITAKSRGDSPRKIKTKKDIISMLNKYSRLNPEKLGNLIGLSRVRANEYLKELEGEGITKGIEVGKKKFYTLAEDLVEKR
jgi:biotin operon repressor